MDDQGETSNDNESPPLDNLGSLDETGLRDEITMLRVTVLRSFNRGEACGDPVELAGILNQLGAAVFQLARMLQTQGRLPQGGMTFQEAVQEAIHQLSEEWGLYDRFK